MRAADPDAEALRARWRDLVERRLPAAARASEAARADWPVRFDHCFARILLDNACGRPWREVVVPPAWRHMPAATLAEALALGERVLRGEADLHRLNQRSLMLRGKIPPSPGEGGAPLRHGGRVA